MNRDELTPEIIAREVSRSTRASARLSGHALGFDVWAEIDRLRAELAAWQAGHAIYKGLLVQAEARLAAVIALCDEMTGFCCDVAPDWAADIRAAAAGEAK